MFHLAANSKFITLNYMKRSHSVPKNEFFAERTDESALKARIVKKYFSAWANVIIPSARAKGVGKIAYIDLYSGPGRYKDGTASTPLLVLEEAINNAKISEVLVAFFNDVNKDLTETLKNEIDALPGIDKLKYRPQIQCSEIGDEVAELLTKTDIVPSFTFIDPFGYKGLSLDIINGVIKNFGCDCIFFFNYQRINAGLGNNIVDKHIDAFFGKERAEAMRAEITGKSPAIREAFILEHLTQAIREKGGKFVIPFIFKNDSGNRTTHGLVFVTKHFKGYHILKEIMAGESSVAEQDVPSFNYSPADASMALLFSFNSPLDQLENMLLQDFAGQTLTMQEIYEKHSINRRYIKNNYKNALLNLEKSGKLLANPPMAATPPNKGRKSGTFADSVIVTFPDWKP